MKVVILSFCHIHYATLYEMMRWCLVRVVVVRVVRVVMARVVRVVVVRVVVRVVRVVKDTCIHTRCCCRLLT